MRFSRRRWLMATCGLCLGSSVQAQNRQPIADAHNHLGLLRKNEPSAARLGALMTEAGVSLLSWTIVPDAPFLALMSNGIGQARPIASGDLNRAYARQLAGALWRVSGNGAGIVKTVGDIDLAAQGAPHVVLAVEGADFLEGSLDGVGTAYDQGVRHIQLVHSIQNPVGDLQTEPPVHNGLSDFGKQLVRALNQKGILVDLAHSSASSVDQALEIAIQPLVWSHGFLSASEQTFKSRGYQVRALSERLARKIAAKGGAVGLWSLGPSFGSGGLDGYASDIIRMIDTLGPEHVMFGTDEDGLPEGSVIEELAHIRQVVDILIKRGVGESTIRAVAFDNHARCLRMAMQVAA